MNLPVAIVDIGSNSVRLVVYAAQDRPLERLHNEKVMAGLGRLGKDGNLPKQGVAVALEALRGFRKTATDMGLETVHAFATAAVRDASDGDDFLRKVEKLGLICTLVPGHAEAQLAARGGMVAIPDANGLVADLGGGSLDLAWVEKGKVGGGISLALGVLKIGMHNAARARSSIKTALAGDGLGRHSRDHHLYLVGGSFRTLARIDRTMDGRKGERVRGYTMAPQRANELHRLLSEEPQAVAEKVRDPRLETSPVAAMLLDTLVDTTHTSKIVVSGCGVREGFLGLLGDPLAFSRVLG